MYPKISLVHPSRGRPAKCLEAIKLWLGNASLKNNIEYIVSLDSDDYNSYVLDEIKGKISIVVNPNTTMVQALNHGASKATGDIIINVSDDFKCPPKWDEILINKLGSSGYRTSDKFCYFVNDGFQKPFNLQTICIVSRGWYNRFNYIYNPIYKSMFADTEYTEVCKLLGYIIDASDVLFEHCHYAAGKAKIDPTYQKQNSKDSWEHGKNLFNTRKARKFDLAENEINPYPVKPEPPPPAPSNKMAIKPKSTPTLNRPTTPKNNQSPLVKFYNNKFKYKDGRWTNGK